MLYLQKKVKTLIQNLNRKHPTPQRKLPTKANNVDQPTPDGELFPRLKAKLQHPICQWQGCEDKGEEFNDISELADHMKEHAAPPSWTLPHVTEHTSVIGKAAREVTRRESFCWATLQKCKQVLNFLKKILRVQGYYGENVITLMGIKVTVLVYENIFRNLHVLLCCNTPL